MLFKKRFTVVEIRENGVTITHYLRGSKKDVEAKIKEFKNRARGCERVGKEGMVVWV